MVASGQVGAFFDGVINFDSPQFIKSPVEWKPIPGSLDAIAHLNQSRYRGGGKEVFPRTFGPFLRRGQGSAGLDLLVSAWGLIPNWLKSLSLKSSTSNCRSEEAEGKPTFSDVWRKGQRCIIPALSFDEPCWETGEVVESYTMLTVNADSHPLMSRMHKPNPKLPPDQQDKRGIIAIKQTDFEQWLLGSQAEAKELLRPPELEIIEARPG